MRADLILSFQKVVNVRANVQAINIAHGILKMIGIALTGNVRRTNGNLF